MVYKLPVRALQFSYVIIMLCVVCDADNKIMAVN